MQFYRDYNDYDKSNLIFATNENVKVGDAVKVLCYGIRSLKVSDGVVKKITSTTIHVEHESAYPENGKWHVFKHTSIFRKHTRYALSSGVSFQTRMEILYKVN